MKIGDRVKFITMGGWYNSGIIKDMDNDSYLIEVDELGCQPPKDVHIPLPYYARVLVCEKVVELQENDEEINLGDEVVGDYGSKGVVVGMTTYEGELLLSLLMINHKVPQIVKASGYKTKTGRHFPQIVEVLEQIKGEEDGK